MAYGRLRKLDDDHLALTLKTPWDDGTTRLVFEPMEFIGRLAALAPPPRHSMHRHGLMPTQAADAGA